VCQAIIKPQYVDQIPKAVKGTVAKVMESKDERNVREQICQDLGECRLCCWSPRV